MKITKANITSALDKVVSLASRRTTLPHLMALRIESNGTRFSVTATDLNCHATACCDCDGPLEAVCVAATAFAGLSNSANENIEITVASGRLKFASNGTASLGTLEAKDFPAFPADGFTALGVSCKDLADLIEGVAFASDISGNEFNRPFVGGVWCKLESKRMRTGATSGKQLAIMDRCLISAEAEFVLQAQYAPNICAALREQGSNFKLSSNFALVESANLKLATKLIDCQFPNLYNVLNQEQVVAGVIPVQEVMAAIASANMISYGDKFGGATLTPCEGGSEFLYESDVNSYRTVINCALPRPIRFGMALVKESLSHVVSDCPKISVGKQGLLFFDGELTICTSLLNDKPVEQNNPTTV